MFVGETAVMLVYLYQVYQHRRQSYEAIPPSANNQLDAAQLVDDVDHEVDKEKHREPLQGRKALLFWIPTLCDMTATTVNIYLFGYKDVFLTSN